MLAEPSTMNKSRTTPKHIMKTFQKTGDIEKTLQAPRGKKEVSYKRSGNRIASDFSIATRETERQWNNVFIILREHGFQHKFSDPSRLSVKYRGK